MTDIAHLVDLVVQVVLNLVLQELVLGLKFDSKDVLLKLETLLGGVRAGSHRRILVFFHLHERTALHVTVNLDRVYQVVVNQGILLNSGGSFELLFGHCLPDSAVSTFANDLEVVELLRFGDPDLLKVRKTMFLEVLLLLEYSLNGFSRVFLVDCNNQ